MALILPISYLVMGCDLWCSSCLTPPSHKPLFACDGWIKQQHTCCHTPWEFYQALFVSLAPWRTHHWGVTLGAGLHWMHFEWIINQRCRSHVSAWAIYLDLKCWLRQKCKLINLFLPRWSRIIVPELKKSLEISSQTLIMLPSSTHSWTTHTLLTVGFCWRISAAGSERWWWGPPMWCTWSWPPGDLRRGFDGAAELKATGPLPLEGSNGDRQQRRRRNRPNYSCLPSWLCRTVGEISTGD